MADHGYNVPGGYSYHHCAALEITADPAKPVDSRWRSHQKPLPRLADAVSGGRVMRSGRSDIPQTGLPTRVTVYSADATMIYPVDLIP
jgi:hypothetical protein